MNIVTAAHVIPAQAGIPARIGHGGPPRDPGLRRGDALLGAS
jgi:hypothetical protein